MTTTAPNDKSSHNHHHKKDQRRAKRKRNQRKPVVQSLNTMKHYDDDDVNNEHQQNYTSQEEHYALKSRTSNTLDNELSNALLPAGGGGGDDERVHHETNAPNKRINPTISQAPSTPTTTTAATPSTATTTWDSVFRQAALVEPLGGDLDHDETFRPPAPVVHSGLSQIAQLLLSPSDPPPVFLPVGGNDEEEEEPKITTSANPSADAAVARATTAAKHSPLRETKKRKKRKRSQNKDQPPPQQPLMLQDLHKLVKQEDALKSEPSQCDDDDDDDELVNEPSSCLEGHLVPSTDDASANRMVLVDRQKGTVYSSTQRDDTTGDLIQIGEWNEGKVTLWPQQEPSPHDHVVTSATSSTTITEDDDGNHHGLDKKQADGEPQFPFPTDPDDHCETPLQAYRDVQPFLQFLQQEHDQQQARHITMTKAPKGKSSASSSLRIYDPYYCNGAVKRHFSVLGFDQVYNVKEDCYQVWKSGQTTPQFDVLVTNPPYSGDHMERLLQQLFQSSSFHNRPWLLLLPNWVHKKDYYKQHTATRRCQPFYLVPQKRYVYEPPRHFRQPKRSDVHVKSSPFVSMWYIWGGTKERNEKWIQRYHAWQQQQQQRQQDDAVCQLARTTSALRDMRRRHNSSSKKQRGHKNNNPNM